MPSTLADPSMETASATTDAGSDDAHAVFLYPTGEPTVNNIDTVQVSYDTIWQHANLTLYCEVDNEDTWAMATINMISSDGTYAIAPIQAEMDIPNFPASCHFMIEDANNHADAVTGAGFTMVSTKGVASTYALQATVAAPSATHTGSGARPTVDASSTTGTASPTGGEGTSNLTGSSAAQTGVAPASSGGLSPGAKGGLAIGIIAAVLAVLAGVFLFFRRSRKQMQRLDSTARTSPTEKAAAASGAPQINTQPTERKSKQEPIASPIFQSEPNNRNSEDWRRFFGSAMSRRGPTAL
ncbi:uncharacterized protein A1O9_11622 [Exophiala aquamarina CBS 119918]|uniref:Mid2 domain-containing protein n=1 Tax=Exophiala aquamarina CBS 119918 TaxID=1182545 RepID=A0A072NXQ8_9EURO|nr:uncharacterized protein A1O9_11622 [Exophiala aquamarina CBS 119918]KEF52381.1 hypothetical protein A1O9_11622 [Exophiala aquamarina CBS 119918]